MGRGPATDDGRVDASRGSRLQRNRVECIEADMADEVYKRHNTSLTPGYAPRFERRPVAPDLAGDVLGIVGYAENGSALVNSLELAPLVVPLIISFGEEFEIGLGRVPTADDRYGSFTSGLFPGFVSINSTGRAECIQVDFTPRGAFRFFRMPLSEIAMKMVPLDDLGERKFGALRSRLSSEPDWTRRFELVEVLLRDRLHGDSDRDTTVDRAFRTIVSGMGQVPVSDVARDIGWSRKHLLQKFREEIGIGPKAISRMVRFNRAVDLSRSRDFAGWAEIAAECGYSDQAHLVREFREFAGTTPAALANLGS